jgi:hypothetical protein
MANRGRHEFSVQEAVNMDSFVSWNYEELNLHSTDTDACTFITKEDPAKKVIIYNKPGSASATIEDTDVLSLTINGASAPGILKIDATDLPFTITGMMVTSLSVTTSDNDGTEAVSVLSFH